MGLLDKNQIIQLAATALNIHPDADGSAVRVERLDKPGEAYYLVEFRHPTAPTAIAAVDPISGAIKGSAPLPAGRHHFIIDETRARELQQLGPDAILRLVWRPSAISRSPLYPFWEASRGSQIAYIDHGGKLWQDVSEARG